MILFGFQKIVFKMVIGSHHGFRNDLLRQICCYAFCFVHAKILRNFAILDITFFEHLCTNYWIIFRGEKSEFADAQEWSKKTQPKKYARINKNK